MQTRKPTGRAPWPITLLAGMEKSGKSWAAAEATGHPLIRNAYWLGIGEDDPDEYAQVPGADFSIIEHDGTYGAIKAALQEVTSLEQDPAQPDLLIVDSMGRLWAQLSDMAQAEANQRAAEKAAKYRRAAPDDDVQIGMDLWNRAKGRWGEVLDLLRAFPGPVIVTARLSVVSVMDAEGKPTKEKVDKVEAEKNLVYDVGAVVKLHARGQALLEGVRSTRLQLDRPTPLKDFSMANLWEAMGVGEDMEPRRHVPQPTVTPEQQEAAQEPQEARQRPQGAPAEESADGIVDAEVVGEDVTPLWVDAINAADTLAELNAVFADAKSKGAHTNPALREVFAQRGADLKAAA